MIKKSYLLLLLPLITFASVKPENILLSPFCQKGYHNTYKSLPSPKAFSYSRESDTGQDLCNWSYGNATVEEAKTAAMKNCTDSVMKSPCYIIAVDDKFTAKKGQFSPISIPDNASLSQTQLSKLKSEAKTQIAGTCLPFFEKYLAKKGHKAFGYSLDEDGKFACGDMANHWNLDNSKKEALKGCKNHKNLLGKNAPLSPCKLYAVGNTIVAKKGDFAKFTAPDDIPLSDSEKKAIMIEAKKSIIGNCLPFFEKYLNNKGHKSFAYAIDPDGKFSCGQGSKYTSQKKANKSALKYCAEGDLKKHPKSPCKVFATGNKILLSLKDYGIEAEEKTDNDLPKEKRKELLHMAETFIDSTPCQSSLRIYLYPHKQQAFYLAVDRDGKQACGWSYAKASIQDAKEKAKAECENHKKKKSMISECKPFFVNFNVINQEKDFGIKRGTDDYINAIFKGNLIKVKEYVAVGMDVNAVSKKDGITPLFLAVAQGDEEFFNLLVKKGADIKHRANDGSSLLMAASLGKNTNIARTLLGKGLDINAKGMQGNTPLHAAFMVFDTYLVGVYMREGADASIKNTKGVSAYDLAKKWKIDIDALKVLDPKKPDHDGTLPLFYAAKAGDVKGIKKLLALKADINNADSDGRSPIGYAHDSVIAFLIQEGADINHQDTDGDTPLMDNIYEEETAKILLKLGADKSIKNKNGETAYDKIKDDKGIDDEFKKLLKP